MDELFSRFINPKAHTREQLESVIQKKKLNEVYNWFKGHFLDVSHDEYMTRCPIVIIQGPTGTGKTSTLKWIANEIGVPIKEYNELTDTTSISYDLARGSRDEDRDNTTQSIERRKAIKFEHFVINSMMYRPLYPATEPIQEDDAASEFDSDDDFAEIVLGSAKPPAPSTKGVIIHIESPLTFARSQRILVQTLLKLLKVIKELVQKSPTRIAIVFETLEKDGDSICLPTKLKTTLGIQVFKFNPITRANMKKFIEFITRSCNQSSIDKETIDILVDISDGDMRACLNTVQFICNRSTKGSIISAINNNELMSKRCFGNELVTKLHSPASKKQKMNHEKLRHFRLDSSLFRDVTKSLSFFHILGKIFYQKRLYPECLNQGNNKSRIRSIDRPYPTENTTECLANSVDLEPKNLISWLHQHYYKFCNEFNIEKAALFLENLSTVDTINIDSTQSSQFFEIHSLLDPIQTYIAIESTVYSLYADQTYSTKASHKKLQTDQGTRLIKSSIENYLNTGELYSFNKPVSHSLHRLVEDHQLLLDRFATRLIDTSSIHVDSNKLLVDYIPYLNAISKNTNLIPVKQSQSAPSQVSTPVKVLQDLRMVEILEIFSKLDSDSKLDFETRHEKLQELIDDTAEEVTVFSSSI